MRLVNVNIIGSRTVGGLIGSFSGNSVSNCSVTGSVSSNNNNEIGGLIGNISRGSITNSYARASVSGNNKVGGLIGYASESTITNCYSTGSASTASFFTPGGLIAEIRPAGGSLNILPTTVNNCFWDTETSGNAISAWGTGKTTAEMKTATTFTTATWDFVGETTNGTADIWKMNACVNNGYPAFASQLVENTPISAARCGAGTVNLSTSITTGTVNWYDALTGGNLVGTGFVFTTPSISTTTTYYAEGDGACASAVRTAVVATINAIPAPPTASAQTFCGVTTILSLVATGTDLKWYNNASGGIALAPTLPLTAGGYGAYISQTVNGCESARTPVSVTVNVTPAPTANSQTFCSAATVANLVATGTDLKWYVASSVRSALATTTSLTTGNYYVSQTINGCESGRTIVGVTLINAGVDLTATLTPTATSACTGTITATAPSMPTSYSNLFTANPIGATSTGFNAFWESGSNFIKLTADQTSKKGYLLITDAPTYSGTRPNYLELNFRAFMLDKSGADGFSVNISSDINVNTANNFESGLIGSSNQGVVIRFKTFNQDVVELVYNGTVLATQNVTLEDGNWKDYKLTIKPDNALTLEIAGTIIFGNVTLTGYTNLNPNIAFAARTGGSSNEHIIDDVVIKDLRSYEYSIDNATWQANNVFANQKIGTYMVYGRLPGMTCGDALGSVTVSGVGTVALPIAKAIQVYAGAGTIANLTATGQALQWYESATSGTAVATTTALVSGTTYYVTQTSGTCESPKVAVLAQKISESTQTFCSHTTVASLLSTPATGTTPAWFESASGEIALTPTTALTTGIYYVEQQIPVATTALGSGIHTSIGVTVQADGKIVFVDAPNNAIKRMNANGTNVETLGTGFSNPLGVAIQPNGKIVVANTIDNSIKRMNSDGTNIESFSLSNSPHSVAIQTDGKIVFSIMGGIIGRMNLDGTNIVTLASGLGFIYGIAIQVDGKIIFTDATNNVVKRMDADGNNIVTLGSGFNYPWGIAIQPDGKIIVVDQGNSKIKRMNADGTGIVELANIFARGVAIETDGKIIAATLNKITRVSEATNSNRVAINVVINAGVTPTFNLVSPICAGSTAPTLPTTSTNNITGTWLPATVSNAATATYTFTPTAGQCVSSTTLSVTVKPNYTITASLGANGSISPAGNSTVCEGSNKSYNILPNANYLIVDVLVDGTSVGAVSSYTFNNVTVSHTISASFASGCVTTFGTINQSICQGSSYTFNGVAQTTAGAYLDTLVNFGGCDSILTLNLTISTPVAITSISAPNNPVCGGTKTILTANGVTGTNAFVTWYDGAGGTGNVIDTGLTSPLVDVGTYYAYVTGDCGTVEASITLTGDTENPTLNCPGNVTVDNTIGCTKALVLTSPTFSDNCKVKALSWVMTGATNAASSLTGIRPINGRTFSNGTTTITYTVSDFSNLTNTCSFTVTVKDIIKPTFTSTQPNISQIGCPQNIAIRANASNFF